MNRHRADLVSLVFGVVFVLIAARQVLAGWLDVKLPAVGWLAAAALITLGAVGLVGAVRGGREDEPAAAPAEGPQD
jgi:hypothetical protein